MVMSFGFAILIGAILGLLAGLGVGGGSLLMLWLTLILNTEYAVARGINLLFFLPSALIACCFRWKQGTLPVKALPGAIAAGCICAGVSACLGMQLELDMLKTLFGYLLLITGVRELLYKPNRKTEDP